MTMNTFRFNSQSDARLIALIDAVHDVNLKLVKALLANRAVANKFIKPDGVKYLPAVTDMAGEELSPLIVAIKLLHPKSQCSSDIMMEIFDGLVNSVADVNKLCPFLGEHPSCMLLPWEMSNV